MLLRRITEHVKAQNWLAVGLDFLIVVVGVFVGLQVQNWSEERNSRELERHYLSRLLADMDNSIVGTERTLRFVEYNQANAWIVHQSLTSCTMPKDKQDRFADGLYQLGRFLPVFYDLGTVNEMQSAGTFSIIRNPELRARLTRLVGDANQYTEILTPIATRASLLLVQFDRYLTVNREHFKPNSGSITMDEADIDFQAMCENRELLPVLSMIRSMNQFHIDRYEIALEAVREARAALRAELGLAPDAVSIE